MTNASANLMISAYGKKIIAQAMYEKGKAFVGAAIVVRQRQGNEYVVLHLLCQGIEILLKALLLETDFANFKPKLKELGHNLPKIAAAARKAAGLHIFTHGTLIELKSLNTFYSRHLLRYASHVDILIDPASIPNSRVMRHTVAMIVLFERNAKFRMPK